MRCVSCGTENRPGVRFCGTCGQALASSPGAGPVGAQPVQAPYQQTVASGPAMWKNENFLPKVLGAISWLMVSIGTFLVASGYLGVIDGGFETDMLKRIGYGIVMYAIAAIFVALNRYFKNP